MKLNKKYLDKDSPKVKISGDKMVPHKQDNYRTPTQIRK